MIKLYFIFKYICILSESNKLNNMNNFCFYHDGLLEDREKYFKSDIINFIGNVLAYMREKNIEILTY